MTRWVRIVGIAALALAVLLPLLLLEGDHLATQRMKRQIAVNALPLPYRSDPQSLERGRDLFATRGCAECHGADGAGREFVNDGRGTVLRAPNITPGGAAVAGYQPRDWVRTIRHGVKPSGRPVMIMPTEDYSHLGDDDLAAIVAYTRSLPSVPGGAVEQKLPLLRRVLYGFGLVSDTVFARGRRPG